MSIISRRSAGTRKRGGHVSRRSQIAAAVVVILLGVAAPTRTSATTFTVNSTVDHPDASPGDGICATADVPAVCTLRAAIQEANAHSGADTINLPPGTYTLSIPGRSEDAAATGDLDINDASNGKLTIVGTGTGGPSARIITMANDPNTGKPLDRVFDIQSNADISNVTIQNGYAAAADYPYGGGVLVEVGTVSLSNVVVANSTADTSGGGIRNEDTVTLTDVTLQGNTAATAGGGLDTISTATLNRVTVTGNTAASGGGIHADFNMTLTNVTVTGNTAQNNGGGITNSASATLT